MRVDVNGDVVATAAETVAGLIEELGLDADAVATAVDGVFVPRAVRAAARLAPGVKIEILEPMQGG
jgi:sulfur carrier protein